MKKQVSATKPLGHPAPRREGDICKPKPKVIKSNVIRTTMPKTDAMVARAARKEAKASSKIGRFKLSSVKDDKQIDLRQNPNLAAARVATQFQPGQPSANPNGRPPRTPIAAAMRSYLAALYSGPSKYYKARLYTNAQVLAIKQVELGMEGDMRAAEEVANRTEGKVPNPTTLSGPGGGPIDISAMSPEEKAARIAELTARMLEEGISAE
jgi:hypothetical protein